MTAAGAVAESCPGCHFEWDSIDPDEVTPRTNNTVGAFATLLVAEPESAARRPSPERWSALEYGAHLRDVLLNVRDRLILTAVEVTPSPAPLYREERVGLGLYAHDSAAVVAGDLETAARLFTSTFDVLRPEHGSRTLIYSQMTGDTRTLHWVGAQVLHECEHHLADARENLSSLRSSLPSEELSG